MGPRALKSAAATKGDRPPLPHPGPLAELPQIWRQSTDSHEALNKAKSIISSYLTELVASAGIEPSLLKNDILWHLCNKHFDLENRYVSFRKGDISGDEFINTLRLQIGTVANHSIDRMANYYYYIESSPKASIVPISLLDRLINALKDELKRRGLRSDIASDKAPAIAADFLRANSNVDLRALDLGLVAGIAGSTYSETHDLPSEAFAVAARRAPALWVNRDRCEFPTAESFLLGHYKTRLGIDGDLTQAELSRLDQALFAALRREYKGRLEELHKILPTLKARNDAKLMREYGYIPQGEDRKSKLTIMSARPGSR
jgi:hypothetical protein